MIYCTSCGTEAFGDAVFCSKCGKPISDTTGIIQKRSKRWYLLPIFFDIIGGIICYYALRNDDKKLAQKCLKLGVVLFLVNIGIGITIGVYDEFEREKNPNLQNNPYLSCPDCGNQIILPVYTTDYAQNCNIRQNCVEPESIVVSVGDLVTWTNNDNNEHIISHTSNYEQTHCGTTDSSINIMLAPEQSSSMKFDKAGQYDYCVQGYNGNTHGTIIVK